MTTITTESIVKTILIIEDDNVSRRFLGEMLKNRNFKVEYAKNGQETMDYFISNPVPDLVLMDLRLPDVNGIDITEQLLRKYPTLKVIAQTAYVDANTQDRCEAIGMKGFLAKPIKTDTLNTILDNFML